MRYRSLLQFIPGLMVALLPAALPADTLTLADGTVLENCFLRDEGSRLVVWPQLSEVGGPGRVYPRSAIRDYKIERGEDWDEKPNLPDLSVTFIELNPKRYSLHGVVHYDEYGRPKIAGAPALKDLGDEAYQHPEKAVEGVKLAYDADEPVTLTAHVRNLGFAAAAPFEYIWLIDDREVERGRCEARLSEMAETEFTLPWKWQPGRHHATFRILTQQPEIATINNELHDPLWGWSLVYIVHPGRVAAWHEFRSAYGTFSWEDFYRWHIDIMNQLFADAVFPAAPQGIQARVRLDRIIYTEDVAAAERNRWKENGLADDQGAWVWRDSEEELKTGKWIQTDHKWRNQTEWSLPHELGHQLGLTDWYNLDYGGHEHHVTADTGEKITHFMRHPVQMMHWHGPQVFGEGDAAYFNATIDKPRGYFGDHYFAIPREVTLRIVDMNGRGVPRARVEIFQRGTVVDPDGEAQEQNGVQFWPVVENGNFSHPVSQRPVIAGTTDDAGVLRLPNRPVQEVTTLNGFQRRANPFGNINVVGERGLLLVRVSEIDPRQDIPPRAKRPAHFWLEIHQFVTAWFRGQQDSLEITLQTPFGSIDSPPAPQSVRAERIDEHQVRVFWERPATIHEAQYLNRIIGYRVYRRVGNDGLNDRPWFPVATLVADANECVVDLRQLPQDFYWYSKTERFAVSALGDCSIHSALVETVLKEGSESK